MTKTLVEMQCREINENELNLSLKEKEIIKLELTEELEKD